MKKKVAEHIILGLAIGFVCTTACLWLFRVYELSGMAVMREFTAWLVASALYGIVSLIYDTNIRFPISLAIHFIGCAAVTFVASIASGIMDLIPWQEWFISVLPVFIVIYLIIGTVTTVISRCQAKKINKIVNK